MKKFKESENKELKKVAEDLINKWKLNLQKKETTQEKIYINI